MSSLKEEERMVEDVRVALLQVQQARGLTYGELASRIKKPSGERYHPETVARFIRGDQPARDWRGLAIDAARGWKIGTIALVKHKGRFRP